MYFDPEGNDEPVETWREPSAPGSRLKHWLCALATIAAVVAVALALVSVANPQIARKGPAPTGQTAKP